VGSESVLIVDDNQQNLILASVLLELEGYQIRTACDAEDALDQLRTFHPRLILMDLQLPGLGGLDLTRQLKADPAMRDMTIVALTASAMKGDDEIARAAGCDGYLAKPIDARSFGSQVAAFLGAREAIHGG
jgi:two-component system cell cycle response regulator DivK